MDFFSDQNVNIEALRKKAFNYRWATLPMDVIPLTAADPDFPVAKPITDAISDYIKDGYFSYGPPEGIHDFKVAIQNWYKRRYKADVYSDFILPVNSAAFGLFTVAKMLLKAGDNAIIPNPVDFLFRKSIEHAGAEVRTSPLEKSSACFDLNHLNALVDKKTKAIFICNPNNPLGRSISKEHLNELIAFASKHDLWIVSDEIWADIDYDKSVTSILSTELVTYSKRIVVSGLSKNFGLAALRIGYVICPDEKTFEELLYASGHLTTASGLSPLAQAAGTAALNDCEFWLDAFLEHLGKMRQLTLDFLEQSNLFYPVHPNTTYLVFPEFKTPVSNIEMWLNQLKDEARVALVPGGTNWFESASENHVRICYATSEKILNEAFERMLNAPMFQNK
jgi:aspartate/methionine/tyrosine aminotransferase